MGVVSKHYERWLNKVSAAKSRIMGAINRAPGYKTSIELTLELIELRKPTCKGAPEWVDTMLSSFTEGYREGRIESRRELTLDGTWYQGEFYASRGEGKGNPLVAGSTADLANKVGGWAELNNLNLVGCIVWASNLAPYWCRIAKEAWPGHDVRADYEWVKTKQGYEPAVAQS